MDTAELHELARQYGTPFFLYDADVVSRRIQDIREQLSGLVKVYYAVKANPNLALLRALRASADGLDISSGGELEQALAAGYSGAQLSFAGPAKTTAELTASIRAGVGCISVESPRELAECIEIASRSGVRANVTLRVNPDLLNRSFSLKMGGRAVQFGIDEQELLQAAAMVRANERALAFRGIHIYAGSQCFEVSGVVEGVQNTLRIAREVEAQTGLFCHVINLGGGFGVSHGPDGRELDVAALGPVLTPVLRDFRESSPSPREIVFELGRYLVAAAGIYVARVISTKVSRGKSFIIVDGGLHHHLAAAGTFGAALRSNFALANASRPDEPAVKCNVAGPSCNPTDLLGVDVELPPAQLGDLIAVMRSGSYGFTASPLLFLGRPTAVELVRTNGQVLLGRASRTMTEFN